MKTCIGWYDVKMNDVDIPLVITYCNKYKTTNFENTRRFVDTLKANEWDHVVLGDGEVWEHFITKMKSYKAHLATLDPNKIVVVSDAHDVYCLRHPHYFVEEFKALQKPIVASMELFAEGCVNYNPNQTYFQVTWLGPYFEHHGMHIKGNDHCRKYINSGLLCGYAKDVLSLYTWGIENDFADDQKAAGAYANAFPEKIHLDMNADLLHSCTSGVNFGLHSHAQVMDSPSFGELFGQSAYFLHIPGFNCGGGQPLLYNLVYDVLQKYNIKTATQTYPSYNFVKFKKYHDNYK